MAVAQSTTESLNFAAKILLAAGREAEERDAVWHASFEALGPAPSAWDCLQLAMTAPGPVLRGWLLGMASARL